MVPRVSIVIPVYNEGSQVEPILKRIAASVGFEHEILVVYDDDSDSTLPTLKLLQRDNPSFVPVLNSLGKGPAKAIRSGFLVASAPVVIVTMADGCDDPDQVGDLVKLVERGVVIASASRYVKGGQQVGGPWVKSFVSRLAGKSLFYLARVGTRDATNSFKAYSRQFVNEVQIESEHGFEIGLELVAKARRRRLPVAEIPTIWLDRSFGVSNFKFSRWLPHYIKWYIYAFGAKISK
jgi:glycosyltransferase involved in cell wall biosynthesis